MNKANYPILMREINLQSVLARKFFLTNFMLLVSFYNLLGKKYKTRGFLMFSGGIGRVSFMNSVKKQSIISFLQSNYFGKKSLDSLKPPVTEYFYVLLCKITGFRAARRL